MLERGHLLKVEDLMYVDEAFPLVREETPVREALFEVTSKRLGVTGVCDLSGSFMGVLTDGDLRSGLERFSDLLDRKDSEVMTRSPKWVGAEDLAVENVKRMEHFSITSLFVYRVSNNGRPVGIIHLHDLLKSGAV
jgi:arabinose-5-phosphate isomerase